MRPADDGFTWKEEGVAGTRPAKPTPGWRACATPDILKWKGKCGTKIKPSFSLKNEKKISKTMGKYDIHSPQNKQGFVE